MLYSSKNIYKSQGRGKVIANLSFFFFFPNLTLALGFIMEPENFLFNHEIVLQL